MASKAVFFTTRQFLRSHRLIPSRSSVRTAKILSFCLLSIHSLTGCNYWTYAHSQAATGYSNNQSLKLNLIYLILLTLDADRSYADRPTSWQASTLLIMTGESLFAKYMVFWWHAFPLKLAGRHGILIMKRCEMTCYFEPSLGIGLESRYTSTNGEKHVFGESKKLCHGDRKDSLEGFSDDLGSSGQLEHVKSFCICFFCVGSFFQTPLVTNKYSGIHSQSSQTRVGSGWRHQGDLSISVCFFFDDLGQEGHHHHQRISCWQLGDFIGYCRSLFNFFLRSSFRSVFGPLARKLIEAWYCGCGLGLGKSWHYYGRDIVFYRLSYGQIHTHRR